MAGQRSPTSKVSTERDDPHPNPNPSPFRGRARIKFAASTSHGVEQSRAASSFLLRKEGGIRQSCSSRYGVRVASPLSSNLLLPQRRRSNGWNPWLVGPGHALARDLHVDEIRLAFNRMLAR